MSHSSRDARGFTLVELVLAMGLFSLLMIAVLGLLDTSLGLIGSTEGRRDLVELSSSVTGILARDFTTAESGPRGDLLADWILLDGDGDGTNGAPYPRLRVVRRVSAAELARMQAGSEDPVPGEGLVEVVWAVIPVRTGGGEAAPERVLWRGERVVGDENSTSLLSPEFFDENGYPLPGVLEEVAAGVLWFAPAFATQATALGGGWAFALGGPGPLPADGLPPEAAAALSWDARGEGRPNGEEHGWNRPHPGLPEAGDLPTMPRRIRFEIVFERPADRDRRTRITAEVGAEDVQIVVRDPSRLPADGEMVLIGEEWMEILSRDGGQFRVRRACRGSRLLPHPVGALVHFGRTIVREVGLPVHREEWPL